MKTIITFIILLTTTAYPQYPAFFPQEFIRLEGPGMGFNVEVHDINNDGKQDIIVGNWNDTYIYYGGGGVLDDTVDLVYTGRCLAVCDYNGDGYKDLITMHFTGFDNARDDYDGEILFYYGSNATPSIDTIPEYSIPLPTLYPTRDRFSVGVARPGVVYGDLNNDGKVDLVFNSENVLPKLGIGAIYIYMGNETPPDTATYKVQGRGFNPGEPPIYDFGSYFQIGNVNGDEYDDLLLSFKINKIPPAPNPIDSLDVLNIYLGVGEFAFVEGGETMHYESRLKNSYYSFGWFKRQFSVMDLNGDGFSDLIISHYYNDSTDHVHYGSVNGLDTIPSFYLTDPDTTRDDIVVGGMCHNVGDWNNDGYNDFLLKQAGFKTFSVHLGGPHINNRNPYGLRGLLEAHGEFPSKAIGCGDQNGDGIKDFVVTADPYNKDVLGYVIIFKGRDDIVVNVDNEKKGSQPLDFRLEQNYPNPFNPKTVISYQLAVFSQVKVTVYDVLGKEIATLVDEEKPGGSYWVEFDAEKYKLSSGTYFYKLKAEGGEVTKKMILLR